MKTSLLDRITRATGTAFVALALLVTGAVSVFATTYFSQGTDANTLTNWKTARDGTGTSPLNFTSGDTFVIESPDAMTTSAAWTVSGAGSKIQIESGGTLTANNIVAVPTFQVDNGGTYIHNAVGSTANGVAADLPGSTTRTFGASSTVEFQKWANGGTSPTALPSGISWGNLKINVALLAGSWNQTGNLTTIAGNLTIQATGGTTREFRLTGAASPTINLTGDLLVSGGICSLSNGAGVVTLNISGNLSQTGGTFNTTGSSVSVVNFTGGAANVSITLASGTFTPTNMNWTVASGKKLSVSGSFAPLVASSRTMVVNGTFQIDPTTTLGTTGTWSYASGASLSFNESAPRTVDGTSQFWPTSNAPTNVNVSGAGTVTLNVARTVSGNLTMSNGAMSLGADLTINGSLDLGARKITTNANKVVIPATGSVTNSGNGYVVGNLQKGIPTGSNVSRTFEIGDALNYTPASVSFASVTGAGNITGSTAVGAPPLAATLDASKYVNRSWTLANSGVAFTNYDATLNFASGDILGSGNPSNFIVAKNSSSTWTHPTVGTRTATSTQATGMTSLSDFYVGEPITWTITATAGSNGSITPSGSVPVTDGASQSFTISPNSGYIVQDVLVDAVSVGAVTSYNFPSVSANHTISASFTPDPVSTVSANSPASYVTTVATTQNVPVTLSRGVTTPMLGYSVTFQLSSGLTTVPANITEGSFLTAGGGTTSFQVVDNGGGSYTVDGVTLGLPCGSPATSGTLFTIPVGSTLLAGPGTVTITSVTVRDCSNATLASAIGTAATVQVDRSTPSVAVTAPNGGETWAVGSSHAITWAATDAEGIAANSITLEYSTNNGSSWLPVASGLANSGTFNWTIPNTPSNQALVRTSALDIHSNPASDASDAAFTIQGTSSTSLNSLPNPSASGESVALTATVTPSTATGTVEFFDGATSLGTSPVSSGTAVKNTAALAVGVHSLTATFSGDAIYAGSTSSAHSHTVNQASTTTSLASAPNPSVVGESVALTATVSVTAPGAGTATGTVEFFDGATSLGTAPLSSGSAVLNTSAIPVGARSLTAVYAGDVSRSGSTSAVHSHTVNQASTTTSLASAPNPSVAGESVALTATVSVTAPGGGSPSGTVQFFDDATLLGSSPVSSGSAVLNTSSLAVGSHPSLTAVYSGDASYTGSTSAAHSHTVNQASTTTSLASVPNPSVVGESVALTATVSVTAPGGGSPSGTVQFFDGATSLGTSSVSSGSAVLNTSSLAVGSHPSLTAVYSGDPSYAGSTSAAHSHTVNQASTTTSVATVPNPSSFGQSVAITATVSVNSPGAGSPSGSVEFFDGATSLGISPVSSGSAVVNTSALTVGSHSLTAVYAGDPSFSGSTSAVHSHTVNAAASSTALTSSPNPSVYGESVALTATVTPASATGTVEFFDGASSLGISPVSSGSAVLNTAALAVGTHASLTAVYSGDGNFSGSTSAAHSHTVNQASTTTSLASAPNPSVVGESVALTATVSVSAPGAGSPSGTVQFFDGATSLGSSPVSSGSAVLNTSSLAVGSHPSLTAVYSGDPSFSGSTSAAHSHTVNQASTTTSLASAPNPSIVGESVALTATVSVTSPGAGSPSGSVEFFDGATSLGSSPVSAGSAVLNTSSLAVGAHPSLTAVYSGDPSFSGSTSAAHSHTVNQASTATSLTSSPNPTLFGQSTTLTATVSVNSPGAGSPSGSVEFFDGSTSLGTSPVSSGSAALAISTLAVGAHSLTAVYLGDASFTGSTSAVHAHNVNTAATTTSVATSPNPSVVGESVAITATVSPAAATGTVEFFDGSTLLGTAPVSSGTAVINTSSLALGSHSITATYGGDGTYTGSTSAAYTHNVNQASSSTSLASSPNPSVVGEGVALTATVSVNPPGSTSTSGTVEFFDGSTSLGTAPVSSGAAVLNASSLALGLHSLTAVYSGNTNLAGSTSSAHSHTVNQASTTTALSSAPNPSTFGGSVALTATVSVNAPGAGSPSGSVEFFDGSTSLGSSPVSSGAAVLNTSSLAVGLHSLTAVYSGDANLTGSTSAAHGHTVNAASSSTALNSAPNPSNFGQNVAFTATITPASATGTVQFFDGSTSLGTSPVSSGSAVLNTSALAVGSHPITAVYSGDGSYSGSTSNLVTQVVNAAGASVSLVAAPDPGIYQDPETLTATVTPSAATGTVEFFDGVTSLGTSPVASGTAVLNTSSLAVGVHSLTAVYSGDGSYSGATSSAYSLEVKAKIVATAGANGSLAPLATTLYSLNATPSYTFAADPGYHVASVTVDGGAAPLTSPYTFGPINSNHTIDVQFAVNPAVPAIANLASSQVRTGNDADGTTKISLTWSGVAGGSTVEVYRKGFGNYPEYDDGPSPGSAPVSPASYPPAGWTLTSVTSSGTTDEPSARDFWYYVAYVKDVYGTVSPVSNMTIGALNYHLGDVSDGAVLGGDNKVTSADVSALGAHYGIYGSAVDAFNYLDVGPTTNLSPIARPTTDNKVNFEDLVMFALNYFPVTSGPARAQPAASSQDALAITAPSHVSGVGSDVPVVLSFTATGRVVGISANMSWDPAVVQPVSYTAGDAMLEQNGLVFSAAPGSVDGATFAGNGSGIVGEGEFATIRFRVLAAGDPRFGFADVLARDLQNQPVHLQTGVTGVTPRSYTTAFAPPMPNPFGHATMFQISLSKPGPAELQVFSVDGRHVRTLSSGTRDAGEYRIEWNGTDDSGRPLAAGVYYARFVTSQGRFTRVVTLLR